MRSMIRRFLKSKAGQTSIEYLLLICVSAAMGITFYKQIDKYIVKNPNGIIGKPINSFKKALESDTSGRYRYFPLRR